VVPTGRRPDLVKAAAEEIRKIGRRTLVQPADVKDKASLESLLHAVREEFGHVDILVNSAGMTRRTPTLELPESEWSEILETNLTGALRACQVFGREMVKRQYGRIINIASLSSFVALYEVAAYCASKAAVAALTKSLAVEWARYGVCVNAIAPGVFRTDECGAPGRHPARPRILGAHSHAPFRHPGRVDRCGGFFGFGCGQFRDRTFASRGWWVSSERSEPITVIGTPRENLGMKRECWCALMSASRLRLVYKD